MISTRHPSPHPDDLIYSAISSKIISPNCDYKISLIVEKNKLSSADSPCLLIFSATIDSKYTKEKWISDPVWVEPGGHSMLSVPVTQLTRSKYSLTLKVKSEGGQTGRQKEWEDVRTIFVTKKERSILLHTDKPVYKPSEIIKFRILCLNSDLKPFPLPQLIHAKIQDAEGNTIKVWRDQQIIKGFFKDELELSDEPVLGDWTLEVTAVKPKEARDQVISSSKMAEGSQSEEEEEEVVDMVERLTFSIEKYVLPKFEVTITPPPYLTFDQHIIPIQIQAKYTYGKGLVGDYTITPKRVYYWNQEQPKVKTITGSLPPDGSGVVRVDVDIKGQFKEEEMEYTGQISFEVTVKEQQTGKEMTSTSHVNVHKFPYKIETVTQSSFVKPGLPYSVTFRVSTQDDAPICDLTENALKICHGFSYSKEGSTLNCSIPSDGLISLTFDTPTNELNRPERIEVTYKELTHVFYVPQNYDPKLKTYIDAHIVDPSSKNGQPRVKVNDEMEVNVKATKEFSCVNYIIQGQTQVIGSGSVGLESPQKNFNFKITCPPKAKPEATLIVYLVLSDTKEVIGDSIKFSASSETCQDSSDNFLDIRLSEESRESGQDVTLNIKTREGSSLVALRGVDQSILLLNKPDNDINGDTIDQIARQRNDEASHMGRVWNGSTTFQIFEQAGLLIMTNALIEMERWAPRHFKKCRAVGGGAFGKMANAEMLRAPQPALGYHAGGAGGGQREIRVRSKFPETWIWDEIDIEDGTGSFKKVVPDTLTSWYITGYSINKEYGLGAIPQPLRLTVFRSFFLTLSLPYSVIKGEILPLQCLIHNYIPDQESIVVTVTLDNELGQFKFQDLSLQTQTVTCQANSVTSVTFTIIPEQFGSIMLLVKGLTDLAGDAVSQPLRVKPPGEEQHGSVSALVTIPMTQEKSEVNLQASFPIERVNGADNIKMTLISEILGSSIQNLDKLIQLPVGCGEQNMLNFVADIVILNYLEASQSESLTSKVKSKAVNYLQKGYQRQLTYRHSNGSYSAFGPYDQQGSTWLTAFVARCFIQAKPYITIDDQVIMNALTFLCSQQDEDSGSFGESGKVIHSSMQGGSSSNGVALTAFTLMTFIEASCHFQTDNTVSGQVNIEYTKVIDRGVNYLLKKMKNQTNDVYGLLLTTYFLHLANHNEKVKYFNFMDSLAVQDGGLVHWENEEKKPVDDSVVVCRHPWEFQTRSVAVEMTAYGLLTNILRGNMARVTPIVRWLLKQRNSNGGFVSTQDTVVGLTALAEFAKMTKKTKTELTVTASIKDSEGQIEEEKEIKINEMNSDLLQEFHLPSTTRSVNFQGQGEGTALAQLSWTYHVEDQVNYPAFSVTIKVQNKGKEMLLNVATSFLLEGDSSMVIVEVNLPSGYAVDEEYFVDKIKEKNINYKRHEVQNLDTKLQIYFAHVDKTGINFDVMASKQFNVGKIAKTFVSVYDYYDPMRRAREFYEVGAVEGQDRNDSEVKQIK